MHVYEVHAWEMHAHRASEMHAYEVHVYGVHAHEIPRVCGEGGKSRTPRVTITRQRDVGNGPVTT